MYYEYFRFKTRVAQRFEYMMHVEQRMHKDYEHASLEKVEKDKWNILSGDVIVGEVKRIHQNIKRYDKVF